MLTSTLSVPDLRPNDLRVLHAYTRTLTRVAASKALLRQSAEVLLRSLPVQPIGGGSDGELIAASLSTDPTCAPCLATRSGVPGMEIERVLASATAAVRLVSETGPCTVCLTVTTTTRLPGPLATAAATRTNGGAAQPEPTMTRSDAVWQILQNRRGEMLCLMCISAAIGETRRIDRAVMVAEGRGALRRYGQCAGCGRDRLLCGLGR